MNLSEMHRWSTTQVNLPREQARAVLTWSRLNLSAQDLAEDGFENEPHVTVLYGLEDGHDVVGRIANESQPVVLQLGKVGLFRQEDQDVIVVRVFSPALRALHWRIRAALPHHNHYYSYQPHCTLAYVRKGVADDLVGQKIQTDGGVPLTFTVDFLVWRGRDGSTERFEFKRKLTEEREPFAALPFPSETSELRRRWRRRPKKVVL